jgi:hypothetical protein
MIVALFLAAALATGADPTPSPAPDTTFPEIGRVRSLAPPCAVMRDVVIPSYQAAQKANQKFSEAAKRLPNYAEVADDPFNRWGVEREMLLTRVDSALTSMMEQTEQMSKYLGDPRISPRAADPQVQNERTALQQLYQSQMARVSILHEFVERERLAVMKHGLDDTSMFSSPTQSMGPTPTPQPGQTRTPFGQPSLNGIAFNDAQQMRDWTGQMAAEIHISEERSAKILYPIATGCR